MKIITSKDISIKSMIRTIDEKLIQRLVGSCLKIKKEFEINQ
jgi:hypothetical protein